MNSNIILVVRFKQFWHGSHFINFSVFCLLLSILFLSCGFDKSKTRKRQKNRELNQKVKCGSDTLRSKDGVRRSCLTWKKSFGGNNTDWVNDVVAIGDGCYFAVGVTESFGKSINPYLLKVNNNGHKLLEKALKDNDHNSRLLSVTKTNDNNIIAAGVSVSSGLLKGKKTKAYVVKLNCKGEIIWEEWYDRGVAISSIIPAKDEGFITTGVASVESRGEELFVQHIEQDGGVIWSKHFGGKRNDSGSSVIVQEDTENYFVVGTTNSFEKEKKAIYLIKLNSKGKKIWQNTYGEKNCKFVGKDIIQTTNGELVIVGDKDCEKKFKNAYSMKVDIKGRKLWKTKSKKAKNTVSTFTSLSQSNKNESIVATGHFMRKTDSKSDIIVSNIKRNGGLAWEKGYGIEGKKNTLHGGGERGISIILGQDCGYLIVGEKEMLRDSNKRDQAYFLKIDDKGGFDHED